MRRPNFAYVNVFIFILWQTLYHARSATSNLPVNITNIAAYLFFLGRWGDSCGGGVGGSDTGAILLSA